MVKVDPPVLGTATDFQITSSRGHQAQPIRNAFNLQNKGSRLSLIKQEPNTLDFCDLLVRAHNKNRHVDFSEVIEM
jgi:hypothetical protein